MDEHYLKPDRSGGGTSCGAAIAGFRDRRKIDVILNLNRGKFLLGVCKSYLNRLEYRFYGNEHNDQRSDQTRPYGYDFRSLTDHGLGR